MGKEDNKQQKVPWFKTEYIKIFSKVSYWIIGPVLVNAFLGNYLNNKLHTTWILPIALFISFIISMIIIVKIVSKYLKDEIKDDRSN